jgi:cytochrome c-type biogenesis protein CcmH/NrfG
MGPIANSLGTDMKPTLGQEDRRAVDLLLDRAAALAGNGNGHSLYASTDQAMGKRIAGAQRLLKLLELMPSVDPPQDLVNRTLRRIDRAAAHPAVMRPQVAQPIDMHRQHA